MNQYRLDEEEKKQITPTHLLTQNKSVWVTFLLKVYYKAFKYMIKTKPRIMRACHEDRDWENINIKFTAWLKILDDSMSETIEEKRIRMYDQENNRDACMEFTLIQMLIVVSELFCLRINFHSRYVATQNLSCLLIN